MAIEYNFKYMPLVGKLSGKSMTEQTEKAINEIAKIVNDNTAQAEIINTLAEEANANSVEALEKANEALETSGRVYIKETGAVDLDSYCESQLIYINNIFSQNLPVESKGFLEVKTNDDKTQATQVFVDDLNKEIYTRSGAITETQVGDITTYTASYGAWNKSASTNYVENMVLIRQNSTAYSVGNIARSTSLASYMLLECTSAGTTGASEPSYEGADVGDVITDGSVSWTIIEYASTDYVDDSIANLKNTYLPANYLPLSGGIMTGAIGGNPLTLSADDGNDSADLVLNPSGSATWNSKEIERVNASGTDYIRYESGLQIYFCYINPNTDGTAVTYTFPVPFVDTPIALCDTGRPSTAPNNYTPQHTISTTRISVYGVGNGSSWTDTPVYYIVIGYWK